MASRNTAPFKEILVINGHPDASSFCGSIARQYADTARLAGHSAQVLHLGDMHFEPSLKSAYKNPQPLEPDLVRAWDLMLKSQHLVFVFPIWWGGMPALLKGFFDRLLLPGKAFKYRPGTNRCDGLLAGRSAEVFTTMDTPPWYFRWVQFEPAHRQIRHMILEFCGIRPVRVTALGAVRGADDQRRKAWLLQVAKQAQSALV
jgi:putative NADPH-quinone reductase